MSIYLRFLLSYQANLRRRGGKSSITSLAGDADKSAQGFMWATVLAMVGTLIVGVMTAGVSRVFEGLPVLFRAI